MSKSKIVIFILISVLFVLGCFLLNETLARFESNLSGNVIGSVAFYVIEPEYQNKEIKLDELEPSDQEYIYEFSVANFNKEKRLETNAEYEVVELMVNTPKEVKKQELVAGEVGSIAASIKNISDIKVGDTITNVKNPAKESLPGYQPMKSMVFCGLFPIESNRFEDLREALNKLKLNFKA
jgi:hypothetical protein